MTKAVTTLVVDDDVIDVKAIARAFRRFQLEHPLVVARDGVEAFEILHGTTESPPLARPFLILLDLNMPRMGGLEFLSRLRADPVHGRDVVFVLTTSRDESDVMAAYREHAAGYIPKDHAGADFGNLISLLEPYWRLVTLEGC